MNDRYFLFGGDHYYPQGGWSDFLGAFPSVEAAKERVLTLPVEWWEVVDSETLTVVASSKGTQINS